MLTSASSGSSSNAHNSNSPLWQIAKNSLQEARAAADSTTRLFKLFQIGDIVLHRQKELLSQFIHDIFGLFNLDRSTSVRLYSIQLSGDFMDQAPILSSSHVLNYFSTLLSQKDCSAAVRAEVAAEMSRLYGKFVMTLNTIGVSPLPHRAMKSNNSSNFDGLNQWTIFKNTVKTLKGYLKSSTSDLLRQSALLVFEAEQMFFLDDTSTSTKGAGKKSVSPIVVINDVEEEIPSDHPYIKLGYLQSEAEEDLRNHLQLLNKGGPNTNPFSAKVLIAICQVLANIGMKKPTKAVSIAKSLVSTLSALKRDQKINPATFGVDLQDLCRAVRQLLRNSLAYSTDADSQLAVLLRTVFAIENSFLDEEDEGLAMLGDAEEELDEDVENQDDDSEEVKLTGKKRDSSVLGLLPQLRKESRGDDSGTQFQFDKVYEGLVIYKKLNPDRVRIPKTFVVPETTNYPKYLWGMKLGRSFYRMVERGNFKPFHDKIIALGYVLSKQKGGTGDKSADAENDDSQAVNAQHEPARLLVDLSFNQVDAPKERKYMRLTRTSQSNYVSNFAAFIEAMEIYKLQNPEATRIPSSYVVPSGPGSSFPNHLWGLNIGYQYSRMLYSGLYKEFKDRVAQLGFALHVESGKASRLDREVVIEAFQAYRLLFPDQNDVPLKFVVAENSPAFPARTWGVKLGMIWRDIKKGSYKQLHDKFRSMGYSF